jgi:hypothetical protein
LQAASSLCLPTRIPLPKGFCRPWQLPPPRKERERYIKPILFGTEPGRKVME